MVSPRILFPTSTVPLPKIFQQDRKAAVLAMF